MKYDFSKLGKEFIEKLLACDTLEDLHELVQAFHLKLSEAKIEKLFNDLQTTLKTLSEEDLLNVVGGWDYD